MKPSKKERWIMFNKISKTYDLINRLITFGMDIKWRNEMIKQLPEPCNDLLDIAAGTMDVSLTAIKKRPDIKSIKALDMAKNMLSIGETKCKNKGIKSIEAIVADVHKMPFNDQTFNGATVAFGIRNFEHLNQAFKEVHRVIKKNGTFIILESSQPKNTILSALNNIYLSTWVRLMGLIFSNCSDSYGYLAKSIKTFYSSNELKQMLIDVGFKDINIQYFSLGSVQLISAKK